MKGEEGREGERIELKCAVLTVFYSSSVKCNVSWLSLSPTQLRTQGYFRRQNKSIPVETICKHMNRKRQGRNGVTVFRIKKEF